MGQGRLLFRRFAAAACGTALLVGVAWSAGGDVLVNGDAEKGDIRGWTKIEGDFAVFDRTDGGWPGPSQGKRYFGAGYAERSVIEQAVAVPPNARDGVVELSCVLRGGGNDRIHVELELLSASDVVLVKEQSITVIAKRWTPDTVRVDIPDGVAKARVRLVSKRTSGKFCDAYVDEVRLLVRPPLAQVVDPKTNKPLGELELAAVAGIARTNEDEHVVEAAAAELSRRGEPGWKELAALVHETARSGRVRLAARIVRHLADGPEEERVVHLKRLRGALRDESLQAAVAQALAGGATGTVRDLLADPGAESSALRGWTHVQGAFRSEERKDGLWPGPLEGLRYFGAGEASRAMIEQVVAVPPGMHGGRATLRCALFANHGDRIAASLEVLDAETQVLASRQTPFQLERGWTPHTVEVPVPTGATRLRVRLIAVRYQGRYIDGWADKLELAVSPAHQQLVDPSTGKRLGELSVAALTRMALSVADLDAANAAARELSSRDAEGWQSLAQVVRQRVRDHMQPQALDAVALLGEATDDGRRKELRRLYNTVQDAQVREAILLALARFYPKEADLVLERLHRGKGDARALLHALDEIGVFDEDIVPCLRDRVLALDAYTILRRRGVKVGAPQLLVVAEVYALESLSNFHAQDLLGDWAGRQDWELARALAELLDTRDGDVHTGAYMLLMQVTGDSIGPQTDLWVKRLEVLEQRGTPAALASPGWVNAGVERGVRYLRERLLEDGRVGTDANQYVGATALAVKALRASGVPATDPAIRKVLDDTLLPLPDTRHTYTLGCVALALTSIDPVAHRKELEEIRTRLVEGQNADGGWGYVSPPAALQGKRGRSDHSIMQYAILGLRAVRRAGIEVPRETWTRAEAELRKSQAKSGGWNYHRGKPTNMSMTAAGLGSLVICLEALHGADAPKVIASDDAVRRGIPALGKFLFRDDGFCNVSIYGYYAFERACILTSTRGFNGVEWYDAGVHDLLSTQQDNGAWYDRVDTPVLRTQRYGTGVETAWALLFLKRAVTPVDDSSDRGFADVPGLGPVEFSGDAAAAANVDFVRTWRISDRIAPWLSDREFVPVSDARLRMLTESALRGREVIAKEDIVNLVQLRGGRCRDVAVYAARLIRADAPLRVKVLYGCDDSFRCWFGGELVDERLGIREVKPDEFETYIDVPVGETPLVVEVSQRGGHFGFALRFERDDGVRLRLDAAGHLVPAPVPPAPPPDPPQPPPK